MVDSELDTAVNVKTVPVGTPSGFGVMLAFILAVAPIRVAVIAPPRAGWSRYCAGGAHG